MIGRPLLRSFRRDRRGGASIEFALLGLVFFTIVFVILNAALIFLGQMALDSAVSHVARRVQTGELQKAQTSEDAFRQILCGNASYILDCGKIVIDLKAYGSFASVPAKAPISGSSVDTAGFAYELVGPNSISALRAFYKWPIPTGFIRSALSNMGEDSRLMVSIAVFKTEPF